MTYSTDPRSVVAAELTGGEGGGGSTKRFHNGSTSRHDHKTTSYSHFNSVDIQRGKRYGTEFPGADGSVPLGSGSLTRLSKIGTKDST
jgi:hypothetical protein